jgi:hypothetical protein
MENGTVFRDDDGCNGELRGVMRMRGVEMKLCSFSSEREDDGERCEGGSAILTRLRATESLRAMYLARGRFCDTGRLSPSGDTFGSSVEPPTVVPAWERFLHFLQLTTRIYHAYLVVLGERQAACAGRE